MRNLTMALLMFLALSSGCRGSGIGGSGYSYNAATKRYETHEQRRQHRADQGSEREPARRAESQDNSGREVVKVVAGVAFVGAVIAAALAAAAIVGVGMAFAAMG